MWRGWEAHHALALEAMAMPPIGTSVTPRKAALMPLLPEKGWEGRKDGKML